MTKILNEGLDYHDLEGIVDPKVSVDEYSAKMGKDSDIVTVAFTVANKQAGEDLSDWFERGYDWVLDAQVSDGEVSPGKYLVFVEMYRRNSVPAKIIEILEDLKTLTDMDADEYKIKVDGKLYSPKEEILKQVIVTSPHQYKVQVEEEDELNEMRTVAGLDAVKLHEKQDEDIRALKSIAGL